MDCNPNVSLARAGELVPAADKLLTPEDGPCVGLYNENATGPIILVCEHASNRIPIRLANLGLHDEDLTRHIAWDPGALDVAKYLADQHTAPLIFQNFSRLVYDCNREQSDLDAIPVASESFPIAGNQNLTASQKRLRYQEIYCPFAERLETEIKSRINAESPPIIITIHSFTPVYHGTPREVELGILHDTDSRLADALIDIAPDITGLICRRNEPYSAKDRVTHTVRKHALPYGLANAMIELRHDLLNDPQECHKISDRLSQTIRQALMRVSTLRNNSPYSTDRRLNA